MGNKRIGELPVRREVVGSELIPFEDNGVNGVLEVRSIYRPFDVVSVTHEELKALRDAGELEAGRSYRITDYYAFTTQVGTVSANHPFDIIVTADSPSSLSEDARAALHEGDDYFAGCDLGAWRLSYCLDNDAERFSWAQWNGKGVVYNLIYEHNNEAPFDFKGILFERNSEWASSHWDWCDNVIGFRPDEGESIWLYVFSFVNSNREVLDLSVNGVNYVRCGENRINGLVNNKIYKLADNLFVMSQYWLSRNSGNDFGFYNNKFGDYCYTNTLGNSCYDNVFGNNCFRNVFYNNCKFNEFGDNCSSNTFKNNASSNTLSVGCQANTLGSSCYANAFGANCTSNVLGDYCSNNSFSSACSSNVFGQYCVSNVIASTFSNNTLGATCSYNRFGCGVKFNNCGMSFSYNVLDAGCENNQFPDYFKNNRVGSGCTYLIITPTTTGSSSVQFYNIQDGVKGSYSTKLTISVVRNRNFHTEVGYDSAGQLVYQDGQNSEGYVDEQIGYRTYINASYLLNNYMLGDFPDVLQSLISGGYIDLINKVGTEITYSAGSQGFKRYRYNGGGDVSVASNWSDITGVTKREFDDIIGDINAILDEINGEVI